LGVGPDVTAEGLKAIAKVPSLESLRLWRATITADGFKALAPAPKLAGLALVECEVTEDDFKGIEALPGISQFFANDMKMTEKSLAHVAKLQKLLWVRLAHTEITDKGLMRLADAPNLTHLGLREEYEITKEGLKRFQQQRPKVNVSVQNTPVKKKRLEPFIPDSHRSISVDYLSLFLGQ
jgi:hypothetical protein